MSDWRETTLGALAAEAGGFVRTGPFGSQLHAHEYTDNPNGVPVVMPKDMLNGRVDRSSVSRVESPIADRLSVHRLSPGDVVLARRGDIGRYAFVADDEDGWLCGTGCLRVHAPNHDVVIPSFLRYALGSPEVTNWLVGQAVGATMPNLNASIVANVPLRLPDPTAQRRIGAALSAFDELIAINERRIELLADLVRTIYREWFVRFRLPEKVDVGDGGLPSGWTVARLGDVATLNYGKALPAGNRRPGPFAVVSSAGVIDEHDVGLVEGPGVVLGRKGNVGSVWWIDRAFFPIDTVYYLDTNMPLCLLYWQLRDMTFIDSHAAVPGLSRDYAYGLPVVVPADDVAVRFAEIHQVLFDQISLLRRQASALGATRDLLLPRLVTGQLDISDIDIGELLTEDAA